MEQRLSANDMAFDAPLSDDDDASYAPVHYLEGANADPAYLVEREDSSDDAQDRLLLALDELDDMDVSPQFSDMDLAQIFNFPTNKSN